MKNKTTYCLRRMSLAVDRVIRGESPERARRWAQLWHRRSLRGKIGLRLP
jgi:hypothetical protein